MEKTGKTPVCINHISVRIFEDFNLTAWDAGFGFIGIQ